MIYDRFAEKYDCALAPFEKRFLREWRRETLSLVPKEARILEIGAGTGANFEFYPSSKQSVATEISLKMLVFAKQKANSINLLQADAENLPFAENSFDAAFATLVFCSIPQPQNAFAELRRIVVNGGKIVLLEHVRPPNALGFAFDFLNIFTVKLLEDHFNRETAKIAENCNLKITNITKKALGIVNLIVCEVVK